MLILTRTAATWFTFPIRIVLGLLMVIYGAQKVFGIFGGPGLNVWMSGPAPLNLQPSWLWLATYAFFQLIGGILVLFGWYTRLGAAMIAFVTLIAMLDVSRRSGFLVSRDGFLLALFAMALSLMISGAGNISFDLRRSVR
jgi:putative oxidoreductase